MRRHQYRQNALAVLYIHLVRDMDIDTILEDNHFSSSVGDFIHSFDLDEEMLDAVYRVEERKDTYIKVINHKLESWRFDRLGKTEQCILLLALSEMEQAIQDKAIIVNEAVELAKEYGDETSYRLVNGVLDSL